MEVINITTQLDLGVLTQESQLGFLTVPIVNSARPKYKFTRANWYEVDNASRLKVEWCAVHFGPRPVRPDAWSRWYYSWGHIRFSNEKDYAWYVLRWGT